jgi:hypothetical protein
MRRGCRKEYTWMPESRSNSKKEKGKMARLII